MDSSQLSKPFKLCFKNEIHRISKLPLDYKTLIQNVTMAFKSSLPINWALQYEDADGDRIMLTSDEDFQAMLECEHDSSSKSVKIFLLPLEDRSDEVSSKANVFDVSKTESLEFSHILEKQPQSEEISQKTPENLHENKEACLEGISSQIEQVVSAPVENSERQTDAEMGKKTEAHSKSSAYLDVAIDISNENYLKPRGELEDGQNQHCRFGGTKEKPGFGFKCGRFREERRQRMRGMVTDVVLENIPVIAELVRDYLKNPTNFTENIKMSKYQEEITLNNAMRPVHYRVTCDGCGTNPITGIRYKCAVCEDFDYCEKCESSREHPHPFLKIKDPKHHPRAMITILQEDFPMESQQDLGKSIAERFSYFSNETRNKMSEAIDQISEKLFATAPHKEEAQPKEEICLMTEHKEQINSEKIGAKQKEDDLISLTFTKEICTIPARITVNDKAIYKTVALKNSGKNEWPNGSFVQNIGGVAGQDTRVVQLAPGKEFSCILILENPAQPGDYTSSWRLAFYDDKGHIQHSGEPFTVNFTVIEPELTQSQVKKSEVIIEEKNDKKLTKQYPKKVQDTAQQLKEIFPEVDIDHLLEIVNQSPKLSIEELIESYLAGSQ